MTVHLQYHLQSKAIQGYTPSCFPCEVQAFASKLFQLVCRPSTQLIMCHFSASDRSSEPFLVKTQLLYALQSINGP